MSSEKNDDGFNLKAPDLFRGEHFDHHGMNPWCFVSNPRNESVTLTVSNPRNVFVVFAIS
jgi:hypothetical protein